VTLVEYAPDQIALEVLARRAKQAGRCAGHQGEWIRASEPVESSGVAHRGAAGTTERREVKRPQKTWNKTRELRSHPR